MARVYVGTYKKYNSGSLVGDWLDLANYANYDAFLAACQKLHSDEKDPEFLIEDSSDFPDGLCPLEWIYEDDFNDVKKAMAEGDSDTPAVKIVEYSAKAFAVIGDTKPIKDDLKKLGGRFNKRLTCGAGWIFSNSKRPAIDAFLATSKPNSEPAGAAPNNSETDDIIKLFKSWLKDSGCSPSWAVGAIKLHGGFWLIEKPSINNKFCFHDEGPDYELYKSLMADEKKLADYFLERNLDDFDWRIAHMEKGDEYTKDRRVWWYKDSYSPNRTYLCFNERSVEDNYTLCTDDEKKLILSGLKYGRSMLEKRLDTYLKKYGVSKLHTWTYWADA